jgi:ribonuclease BN (tRNA processing enzyme)
VDRGIDGVRVTALSVLGSSGGSPTRTNPASGYLLECGETTLWIDAGTGTFMALAAHMDPGTLSGVVISHTHVDHCADLFGLYGYLAFGPSGVVPIPVYVPVGAADHLAAFAGAGAEHIFRVVLDLVEVGPGDEVDLGALRLGFGEANHSVPGLITRVEATGGTVTYSGDTGPGSDLVSVGRGADLMICEASIPGRRDESSYPYHLTAEEAGAAAEAAGAGRLVLTHFATGVDVSTAVAEAETAFDGPVDAAHPGARFEIGAER